MSFLDKTGLTTLWSKIKALTSKYLPLTGGTITGDLELGTENKAIDFFVYDSDGNKFVLDLNKAIELGVFVVAME